MPHLTVETLARLVDEAPTAVEAAHLESCAACSGELDELIAQTAALGDLPDLLPPPAGAWAALETRLAREGLIRDDAPRRAIGVRSLRAAAAIAVFVAGGLAGFAARGRVEALVVAAGDAGTAAPPSIRPVGDDVDAATRALAEAEVAYRDALAHYTEVTGVEAGADPIARLAALENIVNTTREALSAAPTDPLLNGYHLTALAQREATMKQIVLASNEKWY